MTLLFLVSASSAIFVGVRGQRQGCARTSSVVSAAEQGASADAAETDSDTLPPDVGPGGPLLVITSQANPFSSYYAEILRNEGFNEFATLDVSRINPETLADYDLAILGEQPLTAKQAQTLEAWVGRGGNLIAMRPSKTVATAFGVHPAGGSLHDTYISIDTGTNAGKGLVDASIQFHGEADLYLPGDNSVIAKLDRDASTPTSLPAVLLRTIGTGHVAIFAYDLARSVVYTRQGNPAWSGMERDGIPPIRTDDLFYGPASNDPQPDWIDMNKVAIPQADEQQRLFANLILQMNSERKPLPRFWYFPRGLKAVVVMTGDDHGHGGTIGRFGHFKDASPRNCSIPDWQCVRSTSNIFLGSVSPEDASAAVHDGFEIGLHIFTNCEDWPTETVSLADGRPVARMSMNKANALYARQLSAFSELYPDVPPPTTSRVDCITWGDYDTQPQVELQHGIRLDTNYYYWPAPWVQDRPGMFTGSGMPMRFAKMDGSILDIYQAATQMTDESSQTYPSTIDTLLDNAIGPKEYYGVFTANIHTDRPVEQPANDIVASAQRRGVPIVAAQQMLLWLDERNSSRFQNIQWTAPELRFEVAAGKGAVGLTALLPMNSGAGAISRITVGGAPVSFRSMSSGGRTYAAFPALPGRYVATYN